jgi:subtilisin family serine protease
VVDSVWVSSSRGPTPCSEDSILRVKPELVAPARSVRSTYLGTAFASSNGTSFSAPLAAGTIALMIEANPMLSPDSLLELLMLTAADVDVPGLDNSSGYGKLDALMACQAALTGVGWVRGRVQNQQGLGVAAEIALVNYPHSTRSNSNGDFLLPLPAYLPFGAANFG